MSVDRTLNEAQPSEYDAVLLPGGALNADELRMEAKVQSFLQQMQQAGKPFAVICHAPWKLVSANLVKGRTLTSFYTIQDDIRNAGGNWVDVERDGRVVLSAFGITLVFYCEPASMDKAYAGSCYRRVW